MKILLFAHAATAAGHDEVVIDIPDGVTVSACRRALADACPSLRDVLSTCAIAINRRVVSDDATVTAGDEVAVLPPVSGG
jgi:molybdopterin converting factor subunit 1